MPFDPTPPSDDPSTPKPSPVPPELLAWAQQTFDMEEFMEGVRDIEQNGGRTFEELLAELEARAVGS